MTTRAEEKHKDFCVIPSQHVFTRYKNTRTPCTHTHSATASPCSTRQPRNLGYQTEPAAFQTPRSQKNLQAKRPQGWERQTHGALQPFPFRASSWMPFTCTLQFVSLLDIHLKQAPGPAQEYAGMYPSFPFPLPPYLQTPRIPAASKHF